MHAFSLLPPSKTHACDPTVYFYYAIQAKHQLMSTRTNSFTKEYTMVNSSCLV